MHVNLMRILAATLLIFAAALAWASFDCPVHPHSQCYSTGQVRYIKGQRFEVFRCYPCGDVYEVRYSQARVRRGK